MATYWVEAGHGGTDSGTEANPWLTIDQAMNAVAAGDKVWIKASASYTEVVTIDTAGTANAPIVFEGYTSTTGDGGTVTVDGGGVRANGFDDGTTGAACYYVFKNIRVTNTTGTGWDLNPADFFTFKNCQADNCGSFGFNVDNYCSFERCTAHSNTVTGFATDLASIFVACRSYSNSDRGFESTGSSVYYGCLAYNNSDHNFIDTATSASFTMALLGCTIDGDDNAGVDGIVHSGAGGFARCVANCIIYDCANGITAANDPGERAISLNNLLNSNDVADYSNWDTFSGEQTGAPAFTNEAGDDYTLATGSPAKAAGVDAGTVVGTGYMDIGALQREEAGSAGGLLVHPGTSGGARG